MPISAQVPYQEGGGGGGQITPVEGVPANDELRTRASPEDFGAQVGAATEKLGTTALDAGRQWAALKAETEANQNTVAYDQAQGELRAKYNQYEGLAADKMRPQYEAESAALQAKFAQNLSPIAGKLYDNNTRRQLANDISQYAGYSATQVKQANLNSHKAIIDQTTASASDPARVTDPTKFGQDMGTLKFSANAMADSTGLTATATGFDNNTHTYTFPDTPEGKQQQASYQDLIDKSQTPYIVAAVKTMANTPTLGPGAAADWVQQHKNLMPPMAQAETQQYLAPKVLNQNIDQAIRQQDAQVDAGWQNNVLSRTPGAQPDLLGVIHANEGFTGKIGRDSNGANVINGINEKAFPQDYATIKAAYDKSKSAGDAATNDFFQKNIIDKYNIKSLPTNTQAIVADGLVNHGTGSFGQSLIQAAKDGATPQQLIDMRRNEYQHLAASDTDGSKGYAASLNGWNNRLDRLQAQQGQTGFANKAEYLEHIKEDYVQGAVAAATRQYPENLAIQQTTRIRAESNINSQISNANAALKADRDTVSNAIGGSMTNGKPIMTYGQLKAVPNIQPVLDRMQTEQGKFFTSIDSIIANQNSHNPVGMSAVEDRLFLPRTNPNAITDEAQLWPLVADKTISLKERDELAKTLSSMQNPKEAMEVTLKKNVIDSALNNIIPAKIRNSGFSPPEMDERMQNVRIAIQSADAEAIKAGRTAQERYSPDSKYYVGNAAKPFLPTPAQKLDAASKMPISPKAPEIGTVNKGYTYTGGDPSLPASWKKAQ